MAAGQIRSEIGRNLAEQKKREKGTFGGGWGWGKKAANPEEVNSELESAQDKTTGAKEEPRKGRKGRVSKAFNTVDEMNIIT